MATDGTAPLSPRRPQSAGATPPAPAPFDMAKWRKEWGAKWGANGRAVKELIRRMEA